jgi:hypothetical protein
MRDWAKLFDSPQKSGVYRVRSDADAEKAREAAQAEGLTVFQIDLKGVMDKAGFLRAFAGPLHFPAYFGHNWDAFEECLTDLSWLPARGHVLIVSGVRESTRSAPEEMKTAGDVFKAAAARWKAQAALFFIILSNNRAGVA